MPYKFEKEKLKINEKDKRNIKLSAEEKIEIKKIYESGLYSQRQLASMYNVSRKTIVFCIYPEKYERARQIYKEKAKTGIYYDKERHKEYIKRTRDYKKKLYLEGRLN